ncbi:NAD(P)/FAD-dependent oxidoreductase [Pseudonocardia asaccharolytica]|uniref:NADH:ubiquinone reductase (non-electrogenic) n=1 Tax=Pseudonocardia asaccharolytica DSM 44247 = NBRC 16224 TaxID=1123024 RepID=A0A511D2E5_9PSEU|nr:NAD(P)/FAD-dependent oxidoreductase [Pseudonocardia asaccharolytica]GEL18857.1 putative NADH dehydrogenase (NDH) [Pseudonocardia asaccharolytica DSM 44247 = NBRC 16224]
MTGDRRHQVVVVGGGFGGLNAVRALAEADAEVTVVDRTNHHLFQPLLYQVAAGILPPGLIAPALRSVLKEQRNSRALLADVHELDLANRLVRAQGPDGRPLELRYDSLVVAAGATHSYFGHDEWAAFAPGMKTVEDARLVRDHILSAFEMAELATDPRERAEWLTFVVIGAGPTGVELVGQVAELAHDVLPRDYRSVDTTEARILLLEGATAVLPPFHPRLRRWTHRRLEQMGVQIRLDTMAVAMDDESVTVRGPAGEETIRARTRIWAAGVRASPLARMLAEQVDTETDRAGRVAVNPDCTLPGHPEVFAVGDMVSLHELPGVAQPAIQEGKYVGRVITARLAGDERVEPFRYVDRGSMATIGYRAAVADAFGVRVTGWVGYLAWAFIHVLYLIGWGNRLGTLYTWARALVFSNNRGHRIITFEEATDQCLHAQRAGQRAAPSLRPAGGAAGAARRQKG